VGHYALQRDIGISSLPHSVGVGTTIETTAIQEPRRRRASQNRHPLGETYL